MDPYTIDELKAREILDSRGNPTVEVRLRSGKEWLTAKVPSGASTGTHEALELRDKDPSRFHGKGVLKAVSNVEGPIAKAVTGAEFSSVEELDAALIELDGTENKAALGANAILGVSMAGARTLAVRNGVELFKVLGGGNRLPVPFLNVVNGSSHAGNDLAIQEFMLAPVGFRTFSDAIRAGSEVYAELKGRIRKKWGKAGTNVGDEGGFTPPATDTRDVLNVLLEAVEGAGYASGREFGLGIDAAASVFFKDGKYEIDGKRLTEGELVDYYAELAAEYPMPSIEDPFDEEAWGGFAELTARLKGKAQVVGDDILVTNPRRIERGIREETCSALLLKPNQIGTVSEAMRACRMARDAGWGVMVSHRSGETPDDFIADLVVGLGTGQIKSGAPARGERVAKYNRLAWLETLLDSPTYGLP